MIPGICDHPDRLAARIFVALGTDCPCCAFWRGVLVGAFAVAFVLGIATLALRAFGGG